MRYAGLTLFLWAAQAAAHPWHGAGGWLSADLLHLLTEPDHLAVLLAPLVVGLGWYLVRRLRRPSARR